MPSTVQSAALLVPGPPATPQRKRSLPALLPPGCSSFISTTALEPFLYPDGLNIPLFGASGPPARQVRAGTALRPTWLAWAPLHVRWLGAAVHIRDHAPAKQKAAPALPQQSAGRAAPQPNSCAPVGPQRPQEPDGLLEVHVIEAVNLPRMDTWIGKVRAGGCGLARCGLAGASLAACMERMRST